jgi:hypothetical protein
MSNQPDRSMQDLKPTVWIGKQGCTETMIDEIVEQLKKRKMIKVKWLQNIEIDPGMVEGRWCWKKKRKQAKNKTHFPFSYIGVPLLEMYKNLIHK